jgi:hypothetical protein
VVNCEDARLMAEHLQLPYFETSAKTGENVDEAITFIVRECLAKIREESGGAIHLQTADAAIKTSCFDGARNFFKGLFKGNSDSN